MSCYGLESSNLQFSLNKISTCKRYLIYPIQVDHDPIFLCNFGFVFRLGLSRGDCPRDEPTQSHHAAEGSQQGPWVLGAETQLHGVSPTESKAILGHKTILGTSAWHHRGIWRHELGSRCPKRIEHSQRENNNCFESSYEGIDVSLAVLNIKEMFCRRCVIPAKGNPIPIRTGLMWWTSLTYFHK